MLICLNIYNIYFLYMTLNIRLHINTFIPLPNLILLDRYLQIDGIDTLKNM